MWPPCIEHLEPFEFQLRPELPMFLKQLIERVGLPQETFLPVQSLTLLGKCNTTSFLDCPNMPQHHVEAAEGDRYFDMVGKYYWFDFDACTPDGTRLPLRVVFNIGDSDSNDGIWGAVWHRLTGTLVADITTCGGCESTISVCVDEYANYFETVDIPVVQVLEAEQKRDRLLKSPNPMPCERLFYAHELKLEKIIGLAISLCSICSSKYVYNECGFSA